MHREDNSNYLLYIEPKASEKHHSAISDVYTETILRAMKEAVPGTSGYSNLENSGDDFMEGFGYKGWHRTSCGEKSDNKDYLLKNGMITNSLAPFYLMYYRDSIPDSEMEKMDKLVEFYKLKINNEEELKSAEHKVIQLRTELVAWRLAIQEYHNTHNMEKFDGDSEDLRIHLLSAEDGDLLEISGIVYEVLGMDDFNSEYGSEETLNSITENDFEDLFEGQRVGVLHKKSNNGNRDSGRSL